MLRVSLRETLGRLFPSRSPIINESSISSTLPLVGSSGLEPPTSRLSGERSNQLSYEPMPPVLRPFPHLLVEMKGIEPLTPCLQGRCSPI